METEFVSKEYKLELEYIEGKASKHCELKKTFVQCSVLWVLS